MPEDQDISEVERMASPEYWKDKLRNFEFEGKIIPYYMHEGLAHYIAEGRPPGGFLRAVLENDLYMTMTRADHKNLWAIPVYIAFLYNHCPYECWMSEEKVRDWIEKRGMKSYQDHEQ